MKLRKKFLLTLLCLLMVITMMPVTGAYADETNPTVAEKKADVVSMFQENFDFSASNGLNDQDCEYIYDYTVLNTDKTNFFYGMSKSNVIKTAQNLEVSDQQSIMLKALEAGYAPSTTASSSDTETDDEGEARKVNEEEMTALKNAEARLKASQASKDKMKSDAAEEALAKEAEEAANYKAEAPWDGKTLNNTYALIIQNGTVTPKASDIRILVLSYNDTNGIPVKEYIYPEKAFKASMDAASKASEEAKKSVASKNAAADNRAVQEVAEAMSIGDGVTGNVAECLSPYNSETYMFATKRTPKEFTGISFVTNKGCETGGWTLSDVKIIKVDKLYGWENVGYFSDQPYINLSGTKYMEGSNVKDQIGKEINIANGVTSYVTLKTYNKTGDTNCLQQTSGTMNTYDGIKTYLMNISITNVVDAGIEAYNTDYTTGALSLAESLYAEICYTNRYGKTRSTYYPVIANSMAYYLSEGYKQSDGYVDPTNISNALSFAQQGENIPFKIDIPDCLKINYVTIVYADTENKNTDYFKNLEQNTNASTKRAHDFIENNKDAISISGIQFWDYKDAFYAKLKTNGDNPNINPEIVPDSTQGNVERYKSAGVEVTNGTCTYFYRNDSSQGLKIGAGEGFTFTIPTSTVSSTSEYNDYIKNQNKVNRQVYDLSDNTKIYLNEAISAKTSVHNVQLLPEATGLTGDNWYAMEITTSPGYLCGTTSTAYMSIGYRSKTNSEVKNTSALNLATQSQKFYGYWAGAEVAKNTTKTVSSDYKEIDGSFRYGVAGGNTLVVLFQMKDMESIDAFESVTFTLDNTRTADDWQIEKFTIYKIEELTERTITKIDSANYNKMFTNRYYSRQFTGKNGTSPTKIYSSTIDGIYIQPGGRTTVNFNASAEDEIEQRKDRDEILKYMESMSLDVALGEMGFTETIKTYTINVEVASNEDYGTIYDACGSTNYFYFQLNFEKGNSAYVLANQQLTGDGFRSGQIESFVVSTNMDYGSLQSVTIVPDSTYENANPEDKLCIQQIDVIRSTSSGVKKQWIVNYVGWVGVEFDESGDDSNSKNTNGHTAGELEQVFQITAETLVVSLEFSMSIGQTKAAQNGVSYGQFEGNLMADIEYETGSGGTKFLNNVQIVKKMYDYAGFGAYFDSISMDYYSDPDMHFRTGSVDRFIVDLSDFKSLKSMTLYAASDQPKYLNIQTISVAVITSKGHLKINTANEYQMSYVTEPAALCEMTEPVDFTTTGSKDGIWQKTNKIVYFTENEVSEVVDTEEAMNIISAVPKSNNDKLNVFFNITGDSVKNGSYDITVEVEYQSTATSGSNPKNSRVMTLNADKTGYYILGLDIPRFQSLVSVKLSSNHTGSGYDCYIKDSKATLQVIRAGTLLATYEANFLGGNNIATLGSVSSSKAAIQCKELGSEKEIVKIQLASNSPEYALTKETADVAVAIRYTSADDISGRNNFYTSEYVYATAAGTTSVRGGTVLTFEFDKPGVATVSDIIIMPTGGLKVITDKAYLVHMAMDGDKVSKYKGYYGFGVGGTAALGGARMYVTNQNEHSIKGYMDSNTVREVTITVTTGVATSGNAGVSAADMELTFDTVGKDADGNLTTQSGSAAKVTYTDIQKYLVDPTQTSFMPGQTQTMKFLVKNYGQVRNIKFIPRGGELYGIWQIDSISISAPTYTETVETQGTPTTINTSKTVYESQGGYSFNCSNIQVSVQVDYSNDQNNSITETVVNSEYNARVAAGKSINFTPEVLGSLNGKHSVKVEVRDVTNGSIAPVDDTCYTINKEASTVKFTAPSNLGTTDKTYQVKFISEECDSVYSIIKVTVPPGEAKEKNASDATPIS